MKRLTTTFGNVVADNQNSLTAGKKRTCFTSRL